MESYDSLTALETSGFDVSSSLAMNQAQKLTFVPFQTTGTWADSTCETPCISYLPTYLLNSLLSPENETIGSPPQFTLRLGCRDFICIVWHAWLVEGPRLSNSRLATRPMTWARFVTALAFRSVTYFSENKRQQLQQSTPTCCWLLLKETKSLFGQWGVLKSLLYCRCWYWWDRGGDERCKSQWS